MTDVAPRYIGQSVHRKEDQRLLTGHGEFVDDVMPRGLLHVAFVRSQVAAARLLSVDLSSARSLEGVVAAFSAAELNGDADDMRSSFEISMGTVAPAREVLASQRLKYVGDPIAIVVAATRAVAEDGAALVGVEYEDSPSVIDYQTAADSTVVVHEDMGTNVASCIEWASEPDLARIFEDASHVVEHTVGQHRYMNVPMETRGLVASWDGGRSELEIRAATQVPHEFRSATARLLNMPENRIRVVVGDVGGSFGQKAFVAREEAAVLLAARRLGRPLKWIEDRAENLVASNHARQEQMHVRIAFDDDYRITAVQLDHLEDIGALPATGTSLLTGLKACQMFPGPYRVPAIGYRTRMVWTNTCGRLSYRGPWLIETVAREVMMDVAARQLGVDPVELRRRNTLTEAEMPHTTVTGMAYERLSLHESLDRAAQAVDYPRFRSEQVHTRTDGRLLGVGVACCIEPTAATGGSFAVEAANIRIEPSGDVNVFLGTGSHGQGTETTMAQVVADTLGVPIEQVSVRDGDTNSSPFGGGSAGSRTAVLAGGACHRAAGQLQKKLLTLSAHLLEAAPDDLAVEQGIISVRGTPSRFLPVADVARTAYHDPSALPADMEAGLEVTVRHASEGATYANATHVCLCEVDALTYKVRILRYVVVSDCGVLINPAIVEGQISGGVVQGIGGVLYENFVYDSVGNPLCSTFMDYLLPTAAEVPEIEFVHIETPAANLGGYKGVGEGGAIASPPALINAIADALQIDLLTQPLSPSALYEQVQRGRGDVRPV